jgi:hypothetical protein
METPCPPMEVYKGMNNFFKGNFSPHLYFPWKTKLNFPVEIASPPLELTIFQ